MSLKVRILLGTLFLGLLTLALSWIALDRITDDLALRWAKQLLEHETTNEMDRATRPIIDELRIVNRLSNSTEIINWSRNPQDDVLEAKAINLLNNSATSLIAGSYFIALANNNRYYFNNAAGEFDGREYRYSLDPSNRLDGWFYSSLQDNRPYNLNVDFDRGIRKLKLWVNVQIRDGDETLGLIGTGFEISALLHPYLDGPSLGYTAFFLDRDAAIQLSSARVGLEMGSVAKVAEDKLSLYYYIKDEVEKEQLRQTLISAKSEPGSFHSLTLDWQNAEHIVGISYLPDLDWYLMLAIPPSKLIATGTFLPIYQAFVLGIIALIVAIYVLLVREVDRPLTLLRERISLLRDQKSLPSADSLKIPKEFKKLAQSLESFALYDPLTGLYNKRGLSIHLARDLEHCERTRVPLCVIVFDLDHFKRINDTFGHSIGDQVLKLAATSISQRFKRATDSVARFGGEEFVVTVINSELSVVKNLVEAVRDDLRNAKLEFGATRIPRGVTISAGAVMVQPEVMGKYSSHGIFDVADTLLFEAKQTRDRACWRVLDS